VTALAINTQPIALELHNLLRDLDPVRWRDELAQTLWDRVTAISDELDALVAAADADPLGEQLAAVATVLRRNLPSEANVRDEWMRLRTAAWPAYEALAAGLRDEKVHVPSLRPTNYARTVFHAGTGLFAIVLGELLPSHQAMILASGAVFVSGWSMEIARRSRPALNDTLMRLFRPIAHPSEAHRINSATWYTSAAFILACIGNLPAGVAGLAVIAIGDPTAALVGRRWGRTSLAQGRSLEGTAAGIVAAFVAVVAVLTVFHPELPLTAVLLAAAAASVTGLVAEVVVRGVDDNLSITLTAAAAAWAALAWAG
jgi:dolichol kinase